MWVKFTQSCLILCDPNGIPGRNTGVGSLSFLQGIFPTQGSNPGLLHCRQIIYQLSHQGSPVLAVCCRSNRKLSFPWSCFLPSPRFCPGSVMVLSMAPGTGAGPASLCFIIPGFSHGLCSFPTIIGEVSAPRGTPQPKGVGVVNALASTWAVYNCEVYMSSEGPQVG